MTRLSRFLRRFRSRAIPRLSCAGITLKISTSPALFARTYLMRWKIDFTGQGAPPMLNGWFVWDKKHKGETVLRMLDRKDARQAELFAEEAA